jgi:hypothetical protein
MYYFEIMELRGYYRIGGKAYILSSRELKFDLKHILMSELSVGPA